MILISHRGNTEGTEPKYENKPSRVDEVLNGETFDVEIDMWYVDNQFWLGHDEPQYKVKYEWFYYRNNGLWIHCKNKESLEQFSMAGGTYFNYFWHQEDSYTLTSRGYVWTYPGDIVPKGGISLFPEQRKDKLREIKKWGGICSDVIENYLWLL